MSKPTRNTIVSLARRRRMSSGRVPVIGATLDVYSSAVDGDISSTDAVYATARSGGTLTVHRANGATGQLLAGVYYVFNLFWKFDVNAALVAAGVDPALVTITAASLSGTPNEIGIGTRRQYDARVKNWGVAVDTTDFTPGANLAALTQVATFDSTGMVVDTAKVFTDVALVANTPPTGTLYVVVVSQQTINNVAPTNDEYVGFYSGDNVTAAKRPKLSLTYNY